MSNRAVFLDRDGTLIEHFDYITEEAQVKLQPRAAAAVRLLRERNYRVVMITNQSAVGRGLLTEKKLGEIHDYLKGLLAKDGAYLDGIYYCPYHPEAAVERYRMDSELRKPQPGMLLQAAGEMELDLTQSWMIGDDDRDIEAGKAAGCRTVLLEGRGSALVQRGGATPDFKAVNLQEAANLVLRYGERPHRIPPEERQEEFREVRVQWGNWEKQKKVISPQPSDLREEKKETEAARSEEPPEKRAPKSQEISPSEPIAEEKVIGRNIAPDGAVSNPGVLRSKVEPARTGAVGEKVVSEQNHGPAEVRVEPEIALRQRKRKPPEAPGEGAPAAEKGPVADQQVLLAQILRELKNLGRERNDRDFSIAKLLAGLIQMVVFLCLVLAYRNGAGAQPDAAAALNCLVLGLIFQVLVLTLLFFHRQ